MGHCLILGQLIQHGLKPILQNSFLGLAGTCLQARSAPGFGGAGFLLEVRREKV